MLLLGSPGVSQNDKRGSSNNQLLGLQVESPVPVCASASTVARYLCVPGPALGPGKGVCQGQRSGPEPLCARAIAGSWYPCLPGPSLGPGTAVR